MAPADANLYNCRGHVYFVMKQYRKAAADFSKSIRLDPNLAAAYSNRADAYDRLGKSSQAKADRKTSRRLKRNR
jgi:tetratricopeptide (TPR) repeat protein